MIRKAGLLSSGTETHGAISDLNFNPCLKISQERSMEQDIVPDTHAARFIVPFRNHPLTEQEM